ASSCTQTLPCSPTRRSSGLNVAALRAAVACLRAEGRDAAWCSCSVPGGDAHAGHTETSILLHLSPAEVCLDDRRAGNVTPLAERSEEHTYELQSPDHFVLRR